jgi:SAM-dependent methyltransferase
VPPTTAKILPSFPGRHSARLPRRQRAGDRCAEIGLLRRLWHQQQALLPAELALLPVQQPGRPPFEYLQAHFGFDLTLQRHRSVVDRMAPFIRGRVLEWGCQHALDSCLYKWRFGARVELFGCDFFPPGLFAPFHKFSRLQYRQLNHEYVLEYDDDFFDVVTSNGVLEHVPDDARSVREIHRILKPGGTFVITCLPNRLSYTEAFQRWRGNTSHDRLYTIGSAQALLSAAGFQVSLGQYLFLLPTMLNGFPPWIKAAYARAGPLIWAANAIFERIWPLNRLASNLMLVANKPV